MYHRLFRWGGMPISTPYPEVGFKSSFNPGSWVVQTVGHRA